MGAQQPNVDVVVDGQEIKDSDFVSYIVDRDMFMPDMALVVLSNQNDIYSGKFSIGKPLEIKMGQPGKTVFKGEIVGFEPVWKGGEKTTLAIRGMNKMHHLLRGRKSKTYQDKSDQQIVQQIVGQNGLTLDWTGDGPTYKHVYQHNQTDMEFVRQRVGRMGFHMWCSDASLIIKKPDLGKSSSLKLSVDDAGTLRGFTPRMNSSSAIKKVTVKGWNPETKELITASSDPAATQLAGKMAADAAGSLAIDETFNVDTPVWSQEEAKAIANGRLTEMNLNFITAEAECMGNADADLGMTIEMTASAMKSDDPFNGNYYVMGLLHRHTMPKSKDGGFVTVYKMARDGQGKR